MKHTSEINRNLKTALVTMLQDINQKLRKLNQQQWTREGLTEIQLEYMCSLTGAKQVIIKVLAMLEQNY